jgi:hypothetical protein
VRHELAKVKDLPPYGVLHVRQIRFERWRGHARSLAQRFEFHFESHERLDGAVVQLACDTRAFGGAGAGAQATE